MRKLGIANFSLHDGQRDMLTKVAAGAGFELVFGDDFSDCEVIFGHIGAEQVKAAKKLKWLHAGSAGVEHYLRADWGFPESVILTNSAGMHGISIAEHMIAFTLMLMRRMHSYVLQQPTRKWEYLGTVQSIYNSTITVVGLGGIGSQYAARCKALGASDVRGVVRNMRDKPDCVDALFTINCLDEAIKDADVVALVLPGTSETAGLFDRDRMLKMKKGALILNVGRGSAIEQDALVELLNSGHLGGAGLDVTSPEPLPEDHPIWSAPNLILTPHISGGGSLAITGEMIFDRFMRYFNDYVAGREFRKVVDKKVGY